jgi:hypothetical protein
MATSTELKSRLQKFLADPKADNDFRYWFASLMTQQNDADLDALVHEIDSAFSDAAEGVYTPHELRAYLSSLVTEQKALNQMFVQPSALSPSPNQWVVGETALQVLPAFSGTSPEGVFWSAKLLQV